MTLLVIFFVIAWGLGITRIFLWIDNFSSSISKFIFFILAWLLFSITTIGILSPISIIIGIVEIFRQWIRYRARKQQPENESNISLWREARKNDRIKLIYSYVISFSLTVMQTNGLISAEMGTIRNNVPLSLITKIGIVLYFILILPPTLMRFVFFQRKLRYGLEISFCLAVSLFISLLVVFFAIGYLLPTFGLFATLSVYCILSYKSTEYSAEWCSYTINPILFMLIALTLMTFISRVITNYTLWYIPVLEAIFACYILTRHKDKAVPIQPEQPIEPLNPSLEPPQPTPEPSRPPINQSSELIAVGLASIGRTTSLPNEYLTEAKTAERRNIERPFLRQLADKYRDEAHRKVLARRFMVYKETTLFIVYALVLKGDKELHDRVRQGLKEHLLLGVSTEAQKKRNDCWHRISRKFNDEYKKHREYGTALKFSFWSTLAEEKPDWFTLESVSEFLGNNMLHDVFMYSYKAVERKYKDLAK